MPKKMSEKDEAWQRFFDAQPGILQQIEQAGHCYVTADDIVAALYL
jgi:phosphatidylglycerophosphatase A